MIDTSQDIAVRHLAGGNFFDDMRVDISESHRRFEHLPRMPKSIKRPMFRNLVVLYLTGALIRFNLYELLVTNGVQRKWLDDFRVYWADILHGRPFWNTLDFFMLLHDYRKRQQYVSEIKWEDAEQHIANWQDPDQLYATLHAVRRLASAPIVSLAFWRKVPRRARILEYGCSLAPYYYCYREFFSHLDCDWVLADIPNFPFHYAKYLYRNDLKLDFLTIFSKDFSDPLHSDEKFDVVILTTVLEHLDDPLFVSNYLLDRLKPNGILVFDYIKSEGTGLDHPGGLIMRQECLKNILQRTRIVHGNAEDINKSVGLCIAIKKP
jgi:2-polyprenyl-3-methyl-5-hydroxy-6-metoxy-1,4-benzoquinol methylase